MRNLHVLALIGVLVLAGCSALSPGAEFNTTVEAEQTAVVDTVYPVEVTVDNVGSDAGEYTAELAVEGDTVDTVTASVEADGSATLSLAHTFDEPGSYTVTVAEETYTVEVVDTQAMLDNHDTMTSYAVDESVTHEAAYTYENGSKEREESTMHITAEYDLAEQEMHTDVYSDGVRGDITMSGWYVDGVIYERIGTDDPVYGAYDGDWNGTMVPLSPSDYLTAMGNASVERGGGATIYSVDDPEAESAIAIRELLDGSHVSLPHGLTSDDKTITDFTAEVITEDEYVTQVEIRVTTNEETEEYTVEETFGLTVQYTDYNEEFEIEVPDNVRQNTNLP